MAPELIITISGLRGLVGVNLTASVATEYGCAFGTYLKRNCPDDASQRPAVCIGTDSRPSGVMLKAAIAKGLNSVGIDIVDLGIVTTPSVGIMLRQLSCAGGIVVTASHNPIEYNGIKLLLANGIAPPAATAGQIKALFLDKQFGLVVPEGRGQTVCNDQTDDIHLHRVLSIIEPEEIARRKFKVVLDSVNGAGGPIGAKLLKKLGCELTAINSEPTGDFAHTPEPIKENLAGLCSEVRRSKADVGFAQDPDADRIAIVDENGEFIGEEFTLALAAKHIFASQSGTAAANLSTSKMIDDIAENGGGRVIRTAVGEANVANAMVQNNCIIGGEGNGGVIDLRVGPIRDSLVAMGLVLELMADTGKTVSELVAETGGYDMQKTKFAATKDQARQIIDEAAKLFKDAKVDTTDGCRFDFDDGWLHIRSSNTEPIMRIIVETRDARISQGYIDKVAEIRKEILA